MKVFIYSKKTSKKIAEVKGVVSVNCPLEKGSNIIIQTESGEEFKFDTAIIKTPIYQH